MELNEYPRPANDTGIGVHWTVGYAAAVGLSKIREIWIPELKAMGVKWVKVFNHDGALDFCELLLAEGLMPIVRLYRPSPNPGRLGVKELVHIDSLIRSGVHYFEFNNEPDVDAEWKGGRVPVNGLDITVENTIATLEVILERGGMPAIPALSNGSRWDLVGRIVAAGRRDLFDGPVWQAVHNYARNRPLDYPYDIGNQEGAAFTERFYRAVAAEPWQADAWRGRTLAEVNRIRYDRRNPGATIADDHACWLAYEHFDALNRKHLGRSLPILATECGYIVGEDTDPRYPATTPDLHMAQTLESCRVMMGTSQRFKHAPDYYFCTSFWLLANAMLGSTSAWWEGQAWYSERWPGDALPIVHALQAEPKVARIRTADTSAVTLRGVVANAGAQRLVVLEQDGAEVAHAQLDSTDSFAFADLSAGRYHLRVPETDLVEEIVLRREQREVTLHLAVPAAAPVSGRSVVAGHVRGGAGAVVMLVQKASGEEWVTMARDDGSYRFVDLPPGEYSLRVHPAGSYVERLALDGRGEVTHELVQAGWGYTVAVADDTRHIGAVVVSTPGHKGLSVQVHSAEGATEAVITGSAPDYGPAACFIGGLEEGHYIVTVDGAPEGDGRTTQLEARVHIDKRAIPLVEFVHGKLEAQAPANASAISGHVRRQHAGQPLRVALIDEQGAQQEQYVDDAGNYAFGGLAAGRYTVQIPGWEEDASEPDIALDGENRVAVNLALPELEEPAAEARPPGHGGQSMITASVPQEAGSMARLVDGVGNERRATVDSDGSVFFDALPAGVYSLFVEGGFAQPNLEVDGAGGWNVVFSPVITLWESTVTNAGSMPGFSSIQVEVEGMPNHPVRVWQGEEDEFTLSTRSRPEQGVYTVEFKPLGPGLYMIEPEGLGMVETVELSGLEAVRVSFRRKLAPVAPHRVEPIGGAAPHAAEAADAGIVYLFVSALPSSLDSYLRVLQLVADLHPLIGNDVEAAARADRVLVVDAPDAGDVEFTLRNRGVRVDRIAISDTV